MQMPDYQTVHKLSTPSYVFDLDVVCDRIQHIRDMLGVNVRLCYAMKANPFIIKGMEHLIDCYEVCSPGEFHICERAMIAMGKIVLSGVYKNASDLAAVMQSYKGQITYTCESTTQFHLLHQVATQLNQKIRVLLRVTTGNQFGMDEIEICDIVKHRKAYANIQIIGLQHFSGTQRKRISKYALELQYMDELLGRLKETYGFEASQLEFGPGFYVEYFKHAKAYDEQKLLHEFGLLLMNMQFKGTITLEIGRFIAAMCGSYYTRIVDKKVNHDTTFCICDGGMHQVNYYGQMMAMKLPYYRHLKSEMQAKEETVCNVCGSLCTVNDNIVKGMPLQDPQIGNILEFQNVGAYSMTEGVSLFLSRDLPKVYVYSEETGYVLMRDRFETNALNYKQG